MYNLHLMLKAIADFCIDHPALLGVLLVVALAAGAYGATQNAIEAVPDIVIPVVIVTVPYPGVGPEELEAEITKDLEDALSTIEDVDMLESYTREGLSMVIVTFLAGADLDNAVDDVQKTVDRVKSEFPDDAEDPMVVELNFSNVPIIQVTVSGNTDSITLKSAAELLESEIKRIEGIGGIDMYGQVEREVTIAIDAGRLSAMGVGLNELTGILRGENIDLPAGKLKVGSGKYLLRTGKRFKSLDEIRELIIRNIDGGIIRLKDVAQVLPLSEEAGSFNRLNDREAITLYVHKKQGTNTINLGEQVKALLVDIAPRLPESVTTTVTGDVADDTRQTFNAMKSSAIFGGFLVLVIVTIFIGFRNALLVSLAIPFNLFIAFFLMYITDVTFSTPSLIGLIIVLGMLVDEDIVVVENSYRHLQLGATRDQAARRGIHQVGKAIVAAGLTTMASFLPILLITGVAGEFMKFIPIVVTYSLISAMILAHTALPMLVARYLKLRKGDLIHRVDENSMHDFDREFLFAPWLMRPYERMLRWSLKKWWVLLLICIVALFGAMGLIFSGALDFELFGDSPYPNFRVYINLPAGSVLSETDKVGRTVEEYLREQSDVKFYLTSIGSRAWGQQWGGSGSAENERLGDIYVQLIEDKEPLLEKIERHSDAIREMLVAFPGARMDIQRETHGPPTGSPILILIKGDLYPILREGSLQIQTLLEEVNEELKADAGRDIITDIQDDYPEPNPEVFFDLDRERMSLYGLNTAMVASDLRTAINGTKVGEFTFEETDEQVDINVRFRTEDRRDLSRISNILMRTATGALVPINQLGNIELSSSFYSIFRRDGVHTINIRMDLAPGVTAARVNPHIEKKLKENDILPAGYTWEITGENEMTEESFEGIGIGFILAILLVFTILVAVFDSAIQPLVIMLSIPFSIVGVVVGLLITDTAFGLLPGIAIVALSGIVVNDAIVLIDYINYLRKSGMDKRTAVVEGGKTRIRPIFMTSLTTSLAVLPLTLGMFGTGAEWRSFGVSLISGLMAATVLILVVIPSFYYAITNWEDRLSARKQKREAEELERWKQVKPRGSEDD